MKRITAIILCLIMALSYQAVPAYSYADQPEESFDWTEFNEPEVKDTKAYLDRTYTASTRLQAPPEVSSDSSETDLLLYASDKIREALLNGTTKVYFTGLKIPKDTNLQFKHLDYYCPYSDGYNVRITLYFDTAGNYSYARIRNYLTAVETKEWIDTIDRKVDELLDLVDDESLSVEEQALILHDYMASHYYYDMTFDGYYPSIMLTENRGICQSYAYLFQYLMNQMGRECYTTVSREMDHAWNILKIGQKYYHLDITWDDPVYDYYGMAFHDYFLISDENISQDHYGWDLAEYICNDDSFAGRAYMDATSPVVFKGTKRYYIDTQGLEENTASWSGERLLDSIGTWGNWNVRFSGLISDGSELIYNSASQMKAMDLSSGDNRVLTVVPQNEGSIYGCLKEGDKVYYSVEQTPGETDYPLKDLRELVESEGCTVGHTFDEGVVTLEPSCGTTGTRTFTCQACGETETEVIPALSHEEGSSVRENEVAVTCRMEGAYDLVIYCRNCGEELSRVRKTEAKAGHVIVEDEAVSSTCTEAGLTEGSHCSECGKVIKAQQEIPALGHDFSGEKTVPATLSQNGGIYECCTGCGMTGNAKKDILKVNALILSEDTYTYSGSAKKPTVTVKDSAGNVLVKDRDYSVTYDSGRTNVGKYKVTVKGIGRNYDFTKALYFTIEPKGTAISSLSGVSRGISVRWTRQATQTTGYQLRYDTSSSMAAAGTMSIGRNTTVSASISSLKSRTKYYIQIRTYHLVDGTKYYSSWSDVKSVTTK